MRSETNHWAPINSNLAQGSRGPTLVHSQHGVIRAASSGERLSAALAYCQAIDDDCYVSPHAIEVQQDIDRQQELTRQANAAWAALDRPIYMIR